ncbi:MAG TPA: MobA/MobL family protein, partial [Gammaproteobacteria bacterium]|nr:MobA/MobL family protein [Gammaproteobacteria bacterium]
MALIKATAPNVVRAHLYVASQHRALYCRNMAIYHLHVKMIKRSCGQSSVASAAYRRGTILGDERTGLVHNYAYKKNVIYSEIFVPDNAPIWMMEI